MLYMIGGAGEIVGQALILAMEQEQFGEKPELTGDIRIDCHMPVDKRIVPGEMFANQELA